MRLVASKPASAQNFCSSDSVYASPPGVLASMTRENAVDGSVRASFGTTSTITHLPSHDFHRLMTVGRETGTWLRALVWFVVWGAVKERYTMIKHDTTDKCRPSTLLS